jgi:hypothetical protein
MIIETLSMVAVTNYDNAECVVWSVTRKIIGVKEGECQRTEEAVGWKKHVKPRKQSNSGSKGRNKGDTTGKLPFPLHLSKIFFVVCRIGGREGHEADIDEKGIF